jgi:hypothetical protein
MEQLCLWDSHNRVQDRRGGGTSKASPQAAVRARFVTITARDVPSIRNAARFVAIAARDIPGLPATARVVTGTARHLHIYAVCLPRSGDEAACPLCSEHLIRKRAKDV